MDEERKFANDVGEDEEEVVVGEDEDNLWEEEQQNDEEDEQEDYAADHEQDVDQANLETTVPVSGNEDGFTQVPPKQEGDKNSKLAFDIPHTGDTKKPQKPKEAEIRFDVPSLDVDSQEDAVSECSLENL